MVRLRCFVRRNLLQNVNKNVLLKILKKNFKKSIDLFLSRWYIMGTLKEKSSFLQGKKQNWKKVQFGLDKQVCIWYYICSLIEKAKWSLKTEQNVNSKLVRIIQFEKLFFFGEFDPGSGWTLAACLRHASRTKKPDEDWVLAQDWI